MFTGEVHPYAARFPMLPDADLDALAADIKANGLINPIVLDVSGRLIDGRNRLEACARAGVRPVFDMVPVPDPVAFIVSANMQRRDLPAAQKAHLAVAGLSDSDNRMRQQDMAAIAGVSQSKIAEAMVVARYSPEDHAACCAGAPHDPAYQRAKQIKTELQAQADRITELQANAPDIVASGLPLDEQWAAYERRTRETRERAAALAEAKRQATVSVTEAVYRLHLLSEHPDAARGWAADYDPAQAIHPITKPLIRAAITALQSLEDAL
jgi:hypothetical protein